MSATEIKKWKLIGGRLCFDLVNSVSGRIKQNETNSLDYKIDADKFESFAHLVVWGKATGILNEASANKINIFAAQNDKAAKKILQRVQLLRESIYKIFVSIIEGSEPLPEDIDLLNNECTAAREKQKLFYDSNKFFWKFSPDIAEPESIIWNTALSAADILVSDQINRVKQCRGENCGWLFLDTSKNGSRQWCDMKDCGNVAKVRRYREKLK